MLHSIGEVLGRTGNRWAIASAICAALVFVVTAITYVIAPVSLLPVLAALLPVFINDNRARRQTANWVLGALVAFALLGSGTIGLYELPAVFCFYIARREYMLEGRAPPAS